MTYYKGFDKNLSCWPPGIVKPFQYQVGGRYKEKKAILSCTGFHACENPLDVLGHYPPSSSRYCEVELSGEMQRSMRDSEVTATEIHILRELSLDEMIDEAVTYYREHGKRDEVAGEIYIKEKERSAAVSLHDQSIIENYDGDSATASVGNRSVLASIGENSIDASTGDKSIVLNYGRFSIAASVGDASVSRTYGYHGVAVNGGAFSESSCTGTGSVAITSCANSKAINTGDMAVSVSTGCSSIAYVSGEDSVAIALGASSCAKGCIGGYLVLAEWSKPDLMHTSYIKDVKVVKVDGEKIRADTFYMLKGGEIVEVQQPDIITDIEIKEGGNFESKGVNQ